jgi:hypothetical protein
MAARFENGETIHGISGSGGKGIGKYLRWIGVDPAKRRSWKFEIRQEELRQLTGEISPEPEESTSEPPLTVAQEEVAEALVSQGIKKPEAKALAAKAKGDTFQARFVSALGARGSAGNNWHSAADGNKLDGKHYWLTPPDLRKQITDEFGADLYDPCPFPRPEGYNGLTADWGGVNYVNMPFGSILENGKKVGIMAWIRKAISEQAKGKTSIIVLPMNGWFHLLHRAKAEMRSIGEVRWLATEDGTPAAANSRPIMMFVLRGKGSSRPVDDKPTHLRNGRKSTADERSGES